MTKRFKKEPIRYFFRISSLWEVVEDNQTVLNVTIEILPRYPSGLPEESDEDLGEKLVKVFEENEEYLINKTGLVIRDLAVEVMTLSERPKRAEKLKTLKIVLKESEHNYDSEHYILEAEFKFKPLMKPVFEADFYHNGIIFQEELKPNTKVSSAVIRKRIEKSFKRKPIFPVLKTVKGGKNDRPFSQS